MGVVARIAADIRAIELFAVRSGERILELEAHLIAATAIPKAKI
jgi:hypothetical protein